MPTLLQIRAITASLPNTHKQNFCCDGYALDLQRVLDRAELSYQGKLVALRRSGVGGKRGVAIERALSTTSTVASEGTRVPTELMIYPKIILNESQHSLSQQVVGNQTHFWTEITMDDGEIYCFDNNHPDGVIKHEFYASLQFSLQRYLSDDRAPSGQGSLSKHDSLRTNFVDDRHHYRDHDRILQKDHVLMLDVGVQDFRSDIDGLPNWFYREHHQNITPYNPQIVHSDEFARMMAPPDAPQTSPSTIDTFHQFKSRHSEVVQPMQEDDELALKP